MAGYNAARWIAPSLRSIARQTYRPLEAVLWDDGSRDDTARIMARFARILERRGIGCTIGHHAGGANRGFAESRNAAIGAARGEILQFLDADDLLPGNKIALHARALALAPDLDAACCEAYPFRRFRGAPWLAPWWSLGAPDLRAEFCRATPFPMHAVLFRRRVFELAGGFELSRESTGDNYFWWRAAIAGARFRRETAGGAIRVHYRWHATNVTNDRVWNRRGDSIVRRRIAAWAREAGAGWELCCTAAGLAELGRECLAIGLAAEGAASIAAVPPLLERLERHPPADWRPAWEKAWMILLQQLFRAPGLSEEALRRFAGWAAEQTGPRRLASPRALAAQAALEAFAARPGSAWPRVLLRRAAYFRSLGLAAAIRAGAPLGLARGLGRAAAEDVRAGADRLRLRGL
jgi:GT2 family glycosyltransferase